MIEQSSVRRVRIFISSPGDVKGERQCVHNEIEQLANDPLLENRATCESVAWDKPGEDVVMVAHLTPQEAVDQQLPLPQDCDIVIVILWARFGTPLPPPYKKPNGQPYNSGTEWEYLNALEGARSRGLPKVVVYRRMEEPTVGLDDLEFEAKKLQRQRVKEFFNGFRDPDTGSLTQGYNSYDNLAAFQARFRHDLRLLVSDLLEEPAPAISPPLMLPPRIKGGSNWELVRILNHTDRELDLWYERFQDDVRHWHDHRRASSYLYSGQRLRDAQRYFKRHPDVQPSIAEAAFLKASRWNAWRFQGLLLVLVLGYVGMSLVALVKVMEQWLIFTQSSSPQVAFAASNARLGEYAQYRVALDAYAIDRFEVSMGQYLGCMRVGQCTLPESFASLDQLEQVNPQLPVTGVTAYQAAAFCRWLGRRLPTTAEWERAARGTDGRLWPWGNENPDPEWVNSIISTSLEQPPEFAPNGLVEVDDEQFLPGATLEGGIMHMIGNAWEWTSTPVEGNSLNAECDNPYCAAPWDGMSQVVALTIRGYGWQDIIYSGSATAAEEPAPITAAMNAIPGFDLSFDIGFRCVTSEGK